MALLRQSSGKPNFSAEAVAAARTSAARREQEPVRNPDHLAERFIGPGWRAIGRLPPLHRLAIAAWERRAPGIYHYLNARTHHIDAVVRDAVAAGAAQIVVIGAGYDTRAYRMREQLEGARVFEIDQPPTLERKRRILRRLYGQVPDEVRHVAVELGDEDAFAALRAAGYDADAMTAFICEGLSYYLEATAMDRLLEGVRANSPPGSSIVFDYLYAGVLDGTAYPEVDGVVRWLERRGQPYRFGIPEGGCARYLGERGFELVSDLSPAEMEERYLRRRDGTLSGRAFVAYGMALARVAGSPPARERSAP